MRKILFLLGITAAISAVQAQDVVTRARQLESAGETAQAESILRQAAFSGSAATEVLETYADFLDRHGSAQKRGRRTRDSWPLRDHWMQSRSGRWRADWSCFRFRPGIGRRPRDTCGSTARREEGTGSRRLSDDSGARLAARDD